MLFSQIKKFQEISIFKKIVFLFLALIIPSFGAFQNERFVRSWDGVVSDSITGLQWLEGPDRSMSWNDAQKWINKLGDGWRTPNRSELGGLLQRGCGGGINENMDKAFYKNKNVRYVWADSCDERMGWVFDFQMGVEFWSFKDIAGWNIRAFAVRLHPLKFKR
ncbi:MAG: DUF1566 domain-containing protein [Candidatus Riflebacteria bacterium]|nr:DUF1566 domain-containing protein [Candidatus Riflebacteria bacterium]